jgi:interferon-induced transmembrane protein
MNQPPAQYQPPMQSQTPGERPQNYLVWAILTTIFCCLPLGIVSIVFATQVDGKLASGDYAGAVVASQNAKRWATIAAISGVVIGILYIIFVVALGAFSFSLGGTGTR